MAAVTQLLISLSEPLGILQATYRDYAVAQMQKSAPYLKIRCIDFPKSLEVMQATVSEIFQKPIHADPNVNVAARLLQAGGMDRDSATFLALDIFKATVDAIVQYIPEATFGTLEDYQYNIVDSNDLSVCLVSDEIRN